MVDLDTRLKMLMKDKTGAMPAFLLQQLSGSDNDSDKEGDALTSKRITKELDDDDVTPLSRPPSPFLSADHYYRNLRNRTKKKSAKTSKAPRPESQNSDRMSLSRSFGYFNHDLCSLEKTLKLIQSVLCTLLMHFGV